MGGWGWEIIFVRLGCSAWDLIRTGRPRPMRTCSNCGKEHPKGVLECMADGQTFEGTIPSLPPPLPTTIGEATPQLIPNQRRLRLVEVVLVCTIGLGASLFASILSLFQGGLQHRFSGDSKWGYGILSEVTSLILLWYVLLRRSKTFSDLGFIWRWTDIGWSIALCLGGYIAYCTTYMIAYYGGLSTVGQGAANSSVSDYFFGGGVTVVTIIFLCINPFFEELIARAYLMTEVKYFTNSAAIAVVVSTMFQATYHLYQGVPLALATGANFFLWSLYFAKTNRITPIILAHVYFDLGSTLVYVARH